jgi:hypothetical protein
MASFLDKFGAFFQATYDGVAKAGSWDNAEIRFADSASIHNSNFVYGFYVNNNPTLQDLWNTTPAWGFPFSASGIAPTPAAAPLIAGGVAQQVLGFGAYTKLFSLLYLDIGGYRRRRRGDAGHRQRPLLAHRGRADVGTALAGVRHLRHGRQHLSGAHEPRGQGPHR